MFIIFLLLETGMNILRPFLVYLLNGVTKIYFLELNVGIKHGKFEDMILIKKYVRM